MTSLLTCFGLIGHGQSNPDNSKKRRNLDQHDTLIVEQYYRLAGTYIYKNIDSATYFVEQGFELSKKSHYMDGIGEGYGWLGFLSRQRGNLTAAIDYNIKCLAIIQAQGYKSEYPRILNNLATLHLELENYNQAKTYYEECIDLNAASGSQKSLASNYNNIALVYRNTNDFDSALIYYHKAVEIRTEINDSIGLASTYSNLGTLYEDQKDLQLALDYFIKSLALRRALNDRKGIAISLYKTSNIYLKEGNFDKAIKLAEESYRLTKKWGYKSQEKEVTEVLYRIHKSMQNSTAALKFFEIHTLLSDSLNNIALQKKVIESEYQFEYNKKHLVDSLKNEKVRVENKLLEKENKLKANSLDKQRLLLLLVILTLLALVVFLLLFRKNTKVKEAQLRTEVKLRLREVIDLRNKLTVQKEQEKSPIEEANLILQEKLTEREQEVLDFLVLGLSNKEIGEKLFLSVNTIKSHINNLYLKLDVNNRTQAAVKGSFLKIRDKK
jgi:DNA-binding CsgD family transcriptional regulator